MRTIKFRAWDVQGKRYIENVHCSACFGDFTRDESCVVEQYTGETDQTGTEIYEGDIIRIDDHPDGSPFNGNFAVVWDNWGLAWNAGRFRLVTFLPNAKVIGNVHENPELLEADNETN